MPRFLKTCSGYTLKVKDMDREPPHCHASGPDFADDEIGLDDLRLLRGPDRTVRSAALRECLRALLHPGTMMPTWKTLS